MVALSTGILICFVSSNMEAVDLGQSKVSLATFPLFRLGSPKSLPQACFRAPSVLCQPTPPHLYLYPLPLSGLETVLAQKATGQPSGQGKGSWDPQGPALHLF